MSSRVIEVKKALKGILDSMEIVTAEQVQVAYGPPIRDAVKRFAAVGRASWETSEWATNRSRQETFAVDVLFVAQIAASSCAEVEETVLRMAAEFESRLAADPSIGGLCVTSGFAPRSLLSGPLDGVYEAVYETEVRATCRP